MASGFMGKKINMFLLLMILLVLIGFGGVSVYYQYTFKDVNTKFNNKSTDLEMCKQELGQTADTLQSTINKLNSTETDIRKYDIIYEDQASELGKKSEQLSNTQAELTRTTLQKEVYKRQIDDAYADIIKLNKSISSLNKQIISLNNQIDDQKDTISCMKNTDDIDESGCL
jgi:chromosome segregation ATPase